MATIWNRLVEEWNLHLDIAWSLLSGRYGLYLPWQAYLILCGVVLYIVFPFDLIPDFIPVFGLLDDAAVIFLAILAIGSISELAYRVVRAYIRAIRAHPDPANYPHHPHVPAEQQQQNNNNAPPDVVFEDDGHGECGVCMEDGKQRNHMLLVCGHRFCEQCAQWIFKNTKTCPFCRSEVTGLYQFPNAQ